MKIIVGVIVLVLIIILSTFRLETKTLEQFYKGDLNDVTEIRILNGNSGYSKTVTDEKLVKAFLNKIKDIKFIPDENQEQRNGFNYAISLYVNDKATFSFSLGKVNENYYHTQPEILPIVDRFYYSLN